MSIYHLHKTAPAIVEHCCKASNQKREIMELAIYQIDAFADKIFEGNPAAVCPLKEWLPDETMQAIAAENNLSETVFFVETEAAYHIRWFTPLFEVDLCGHATLASAYVIFEILGCEKDEIVFESKSGLLTVRKKDNCFELDFPAQPAVLCETPQILIDAFGQTPLYCLKRDDYILVFENEQIIENANPDLLKLLKADLRGVMITAPSQKYDFVLRFFAPKYGINEDPVTGSALTQLVPYWAEKLAKKAMFVKQISKRGGESHCKLSGDRVRIAGKAVKFMSGIIEI